MIKVLHNLFDRQHKTINISLSKQLRKDKGNKY